MVGTDGKFQTPDFDSFERMVLRATGYCTEERTLSTCHREAPFSPCHP